jgi:site-specific recombinase XerD
MTDYLHQGEYVLSLELKKANEEIAEPNISYVMAFKGHLELKNRKPQTLARVVRELRFIFKCMKKDAKLAARADIERLVTLINKSGKAPISRKKIKQTLRAFYKWLFKSNAYPEIVAWIEVDRVASIKLPEELLNEEEIAKLLENCKNQRDKAVVALLFDTGMRIGELLNLKIKDIVLNKDNPSYAIVDGKTGKRRVTLVFSVPYLVNYLNNEPRTSKPESSLFITSSKNPLDYDNVRKLLHDLKERTGIKKRLHPHLFRHSRASIYANTMTEQQLKKYFGWAGGSQMAAVYVHLSGKDVDDAVLKANGIIDEKGIKVQPKLINKACYKCHQINEATAKYCSNCGSQLDMTPVEQMENLERISGEIDTIKEAMTLLLSKLDEETKNKIKKIIEDVKK